ncbi:MAG: hypothetical protein WA087_00460 [Candidatus Saccharimonadales bacterium]
MNEADIKVKKQVVEKIKASTNILIAVGKDPSVDDLSAAIGLATLLNKMDKHTTAIFSGSIPPAINFLDPDKIFENTVDSLRDFIIALDKEKADHLRYKVEGDVVKIFITPYRTTITGDDLEFSQGDYNVELVLALGVTNQDHLDTALSAHGQILHDATVLTFSVGEETSQLGTLDWHDSGASSLCEMIANISESLKSDKSLLDKQIATALLTGIVASTERFSNTRTTSQVMTIAAQLMAAGADQQLIAAKLQESHEITSLPPETQQNEPVNMTNVPSVEASSESTLPPDGSLEISHEPGGYSVAEEPPVDTGMSTLPEDMSMDTTPPPAPSIQPDAAGDLFSSTIAPAYSYAPEPEIPAASASTFTPEPQPQFESQLPQPQMSDVVSVGHEPVIEPLLGGTLNATTDQAAEEARKELDAQQNKTILSHTFLGNNASASSGLPVNGVDPADNAQTVDIFESAPMANTPQMPILPPPPVMPDFTTLPPPPLPDYGSMAVDPSLNMPPAPSDNDPSQFQIPGRG